jgi:F-type H+-transporting ATPase subunit epsilon
MLELVTPEQAIAHEAVDEMVLPGTDGEFGVLPGHAPMLALLAVGQLWYRRGTEKTYVSVAFGVAEVLQDRVIVICRNAERADEIDVARAEAAMQRAQSELKKRSASFDEIERARIAMLKALSRLQVASRTRLGR